MKRDQSSHYWFLCSFCHVLIGCLSHVSCFSLVGLCHGQSLLFFWLQKPLGAINKNRDAINQFLWGKQSPSVHYGSLTVFTHSCLFFWQSGAIYIGDSPGTVWCAGNPRKRHLHWPRHSRWVMRMRLVHRKCIPLESTGLGALGHSAVPTWMEQAHH